MPAKYQVASCGGRGASNASQSRAPGTSQLGAGVAAKSLSAGIGSSVQVSSSSGGRQMRAGPLLSQRDAVAKAVPHVPEPHSASSAQSLVQRPQIQLAAAPHCALSSHALSQFVLVPELSG